jgi:hypothetical protein
MANFGSSRNIASDITQRHPCQCLSGIAA